MVVQGSALLLKGIFQDVSSHVECGNLIAHGVLLRSFRFSTRPLPSLSWRLARHDDPPPHCSSVRLPASPDIMWCQWKHRQSIDASIRCAIEAAVLAYSAI